MSAFKTFALGVVCGMRAALGPALVARQLSRRKRLKLGQLEFMRSGTTANTFAVAAVGELVGDKLPMTPARVSPAALSGRIVSGALCGAALSRSAREDSATGAVAGAVGAVVGAYAFYELRRALTERGGLPDVAVALAEDALALGIGLAALKKR